MNARLAKLQDPTHLTRHDDAAPKCRGTKPKKQVAVMKRVMIPIAIVYLLTMAAMLTFPGLTPFNTIEPRIMGIPFVFAWYLMWIVGAFVVLSLLYKAYEE